MVDFLQNITQSAKTLYNAPEFQKLQDQFSMEEICRFSAKIRLEMAEKWLKTAQKHLKTDQFGPI